MAFVKPARRNPARLAGFAPSYRGLGQVGVTCVGSWALGGQFTSPSSGVISLTPDDEPGATYTVVSRQGGSQVESIQAAQGMSGRAAFSGVLLSDNTLISDGGSGKLGPNEFYARQDRGPCPSWALELYPADGGAGQDDSGGATAPEPEPPPPPFDGSQVSTIQYNGTTRVVTVYAEDGRIYTLDAQHSPANITEELRTTAPQGAPLVITGTWDPAAETVTVTDWYIQELGPGVKEYGITPEGQLGPQSPEYPSTDWPGGLPPTDPRSPEYVPPEGQQVTQAGFPWWTAILLLGLVKWRGN